MRSKLRYRILFLVAVSIAAISMTACSVAPGIDGGIVGTGNRVDCEAQAKKDRAPEECKREGR
jgi:hypothetical protein